MWLQFLVEHIQLQVLFKNLHYSIVHYCPPEEDSLARRRGPREERENPLNIPDSSLDPLPYLHILKEIDSTLDANERGDVLIFVSGLQEINILVNALSEVMNSFSYSI